MILELVDQRRLKLTDHLSHFVRNIPNGRKITVKELLSMTSGAYDFTDDPKFLAHYQAHPTAPFGLLTRCDRPPTRCVVRFRRGVEYSDSNYILLELIARR